jgi:ribosomal protein S18 acetylase RimI-like enzyme
MTADAAAIGRFLREAWRESGPEAPGFAGATDEMIEELAQPEAVRVRIENEGRRMFVARTEERVIGFAATRPAAVAEVELAGIVVLRSFAGRGLGRRLVAASVHAAAIDGFDRMVVRTETSNAAAIGFYQALGFDPGRVLSEDVDGHAVEVVELARVVEPTGPLG